MLVLAFDTCMDKMYVTLCRDGASLKSVAVPYEGMQTRSPRLLETIKEVLLENGLCFADLDLIATSVGPGGFTAIRTCMTVARVMAQELGKKLIGVTSFEILSNLPIDCPRNSREVEREREFGVAYETAQPPVDLREQGKQAAENCFIYEGKKKLIALDARRESAYVAVEGEIKGIVPLTELNTDGYFVVTDDKLQPILGGISYQSLNVNLSEIIAKVAVEKSETEDGDWGKLTPLYLAAPANAK